MTAILIVGASHKINDRLEELLTEHKATYRFKKVTNLAAAIDAIDKLHPAILLLSNNLPENDVLAFINHTAIQKGTIGLIILDNDNADKGLFKQLGAIHIIDIYHDFDILPGLVEKLISSKKNQSTD